MSEYAPRHPAGSGIILQYCGWDGTQEYLESHDRVLLNTVKQYYIGQLDPGAVFEEKEEPPSGLRPISSEELAEHYNESSCWVSFYGDVFDLTPYGHPGKFGNSVIYSACGQDGTRNFTAVHPRDYLEEVEHMKIGWLESSATRTGAAMSLLLASVAYSIVSAL